MGAAKRRGNGEGTVYQEASGRWVGQFYVTAPDGRRLRKTVRGATKKEVQAKQQAAVRAQEAGLSVSTHRAPTLAAFGEMWLTTTLRDRVHLGVLRPATYSFYRHMFVGHIEPDLGHLRLDAITPRIVESWLAGKVTGQAPKGRPLSASTALGLLRTLKKMLNDAVEEGLLPAHKLSRVAAPKMLPREPTHLKKGEAAILWKSIQGDEHEALWVMLLCCGLRLGEALGLRWRDIDLDARRLRVEQALADLPGDMSSTAHGGRRRGLSTTKTPASRASVPVPQVAAEVLRRHRTEVTQRRLAAHAWADLDLVFPSPIGTPLDPSRIGNAWRALRKKAGLEHVRIHDLRHSTATFLLAAGTDIKIVQSVLRHSRLATTADLYAHVLDEVSDAAADALDTYLGEAGWGT